MAEIANLNTKLSLESASFLSGIEASRGALRSLVASLDPVAAATQRYNRQVQLLEGGMKRGTLSAEQHGIALQRLTARYNEQVRNQTSLTGSTGVMRAGMQQLSFQLGDVATQFASGTRPMIIFAQQGGQVIQAIQLMTNSSKGFLGFLAGPWGQIITAAVVVLSSLWSMLSNNADAANKAADGVDNYTDALKRLQDQAGAFSFGSPEFSKVNKDLLEATAHVARLKNELKSAPISQMSDITPGGTALAAPKRSRALVQVELDRAQADLNDKEMDMRALLMQRRNRQIADASDPRKRRERRPVDRTDQMEEKADDQMARLKAEQAQLTLAMTSDIRERARIQKEQLEAEFDAYKEDIEHQVTQKKITAEKGKELVAVKERNIELEKGRLFRDEDNALAKEETDLAQSRLDLAQSIRAGELDAARTQADRRRIQLQMLDAETAQLKFAIEQQLLSKDLSDTERERLQNRLAQIDAEAANKRAGIQRGTMGPIEEFLDRLPQTADEMNEAFERVAADGLKSLTDGLADAITGAKSLGAAFRDVTNQIINDLVRIAIQKYITAPLARSLFGGGAGLAGLFGGGSGVVTNTTAFAGADFSALSIPHFAGGGSLRIGGFPGVDRNTLAINGMPVARVSEGETLNVSPRGTNDNGRGNTYYFNGNLMTPEFWARIQAGDFAAANAGAQGGVQRMQYQQTRRVG